VSAAPSDVVTTHFGKLKGTLSSDARGFFGVPYAEPPTKTNRFKNPVPWSRPYVGTRKATDKGAQCLSNSQKSGNEDCLFLVSHFKLVRSTQSDMPPIQNVYTPLDATPTSKLPVLLFIHGGSFVTGSGSDYDCSALAKQHNAVYVTINYRLGSFGWLHLAKYIDWGHAEGNWGLKDQREAMKFTKAQIEAFGGDPNRIMIFGESAGAISVQNHGS
jgi:carboxylesterase type B